MGVSVLLRSGLGLAMSAYVTCEPELSISLGGFLVGGVSLSRPLLSPESAGGRERYGLVVLSRCGCDGGERVWLCGFLGELVVPLRCL